MVNSISESTCSSKTTDIEEFINSHPRSKEIKQQRQRYQVFWNEASCEKVNAHVLKLQKRWSEQESKNNSQSSGYGASAVVFVDTTSDISNELNLLMQDLQKTQAAKNGKLLFSDPQSLHLTLAGLDIGHSAPLSKQRVCTIKNSFSQCMSDLKNRISSTVHVHFARDVTISQSARIQVNGFVEDEGLEILLQEMKDKFPNDNINVRGKHINLASIVKKLNKEEYDNLCSILQIFSSKTTLLGRLSVNPVTLVFHENDTLNKTWEESVVVNL